MKTNIFRCLFVKFIPTLKRSEYSFTIKIKNENDARPVFFGSIVLEGLVALCWAAIAMAFFHSQPQLAAIYSASPSVADNEMASVLVGPVGLVLTIIGVVICPITSGDTALRSARITIADQLHLDHKKF